MKKVKINIIFLFLFFISCSNNDYYSIIDRSLDDLNQEYSNLCEYKRNDALKVKYQELESKIINLGTMVSESEDLSYEEQIKYSKYFLIKLKEKKDLFDLVEYQKINCWNE
jgi:hypothetical protein